MSVLGQEGAWSLQPLPSLSFPPFAGSPWEGPFTPPALLVGVPLLGGPFAEGRARELPPRGGHQGRVWQWMGPCKGLLAILLLISSCSWRPLVPAGPGDATWQGQAEQGVPDLHPGGLLFGGAPCFGVPDRCLKCCNTPSPVGWLFPTAIASRVTSGCNIHGAVN